MVRAFCKLALPCGLFGRDRAGERAFATVKRLRPHRRGGGGWLAG